MVDNVAISAGTGTTIAADDVSGVMYQRVKIAVGADGAAADAAAATPLPVAFYYSGSAVDPTAASPVTQSGTWNVGLSAGTAVVGKVNPAGREYETVAASATAQALGATGATGDVLDGVLIVPATTSPGSVAILDNATSITVFTGGASSVTNLVPFFVPLGLTSVSGAWKVTTGANVSVIACGDFT